MGGQNYSKVQVRPGWPTRLINLAATETSAMQSAGHVDRLVLPNLTTELKTDRRSPRVPRPDTPRRTMTTKLVFGRIRARRSHFATRQLPRDRGWPKLFLRTARRGEPGSNTLGLPRVLVGGRPKSATARHGASVSQVGGGMAVTPATRRCGAGPSAPETPVGARPMDLGERRGTDVRAEAHLPQACSVLFLCVRGLPAGKVLSAKASISPTCDDALAAPEGFTLLALESTAQRAGRGHVSGVGRIWCRPAGTGSGRFALKRCPGANGSSGPSDAMASGEYDLPTLQFSSIIERIATKPIRHLPRLDGGGVQSYCVFQGPRCLPTRASMAAASSAERHRTYTQERGFKDTLACDNRQK